MVLRFQRRIKVLPAVRLDLSKSGVWRSVGGRGAHFGIDAPGRRYTSVGLPGTGMSWREYPHEPAPQRCDFCAPSHVHLSPVPTIALLTAGVIVVLVFVGHREG